jgi:hypothetical protein
MRIANGLIVVESNYDSNEERIEEHKEYQKVGIPFTQLAPTRSVTGFDRLTIVW